MSSKRLPHALTAASLALVTILAASAARAQSWRVHGTAAGAHAVSGHQKDEFGFGAAGLAALEYGINPELGVQLEFGGVYMSSGDKPEDPRLAPLDGASAVSGAFGMRLRPLARRYDGSPTSPAGMWIAAGIGAATTNSLNRLFFDAHVGYDFLFAQGKFGVGPTVGFWHVSQPDDRIRPADANFLLLGVHAMFDFVTPEAKKAAGDRDRDGLLDEVDKCPDDPEDKDGFEDEDGCPDDDNDKDGIIDKRDDCPMVAEDKDGFEDGDGCPDDDNDKDGLKDPVDKCPNDPEDRDGFEDEDGCPDDDNDKDGVSDAQDLCPDEPETVNNYADHDGCPDAEQVRVIGDKIVLDDRVHFETNSHIIRAVSYPLLQRLSKLIAEHPEYTHIEVEGHADSRGPDSYNEGLSQRRAESVMEFMIKHGVESERLSAKGYGSSRPLVDEKSEHAMLLNRRVEFIVTRKMKQILGPDGKPLPPKATPESGAAPNETLPTETEVPVPGTAAPSGTDTPEEGGQ